MKVNILNPVFNTSRPLLTILESGVIQGDDVILVDYHSNDNSKQIFKAPEQNHPEFNWKWALNPREGECNARNQVLTTCTGDWIQSLDAKTLLGPKKILMALKSLEANPNQIIACPWHPLIEELNNSLNQDNDVCNTIPDFSAPAGWTARDSYTASHCYLSHRDLFDHAAPWDESLGINQYGEYFASITAKSSEFIFIPQTKFYFWRSTTHSVSKFSPGKSVSVFRSSRFMAQTGLG